MTDIQLSNDVRKQIPQVNDVKFSDVFDLINCESQITVVGLRLKLRAFAVCFVRVNST